MKKIIFFSKNLEIGGMEKALISLINRLAHKYDITLVLEEKKGSLLDQVDSAIKIKEYRLSTSKNALIRKAINASKRLLWAICHGRRYSFSCNYATYSYWGSRLAQISSSNSSLYVHSNYYTLYKEDIDKIKNFFYYHKLDKFKKIIFVSKESQSDLEKALPEIVGKTIVINNFIDYNNIRKLASEDVNVPFNKDKINLVFCGRFENESKNFDLLLDSFHLVINQNSDFKLYLIGDGPYKQIIEEKIKKLSLEDSVFLLGSQKNPYPYINKSDAVIFSSNYEGFPVTYLESLVLNTPLLTTIAVSDESLDIRNYCTLLKHDSKDISKKILKVKKLKKKKTYDIDFEIMNKKKVTLLESLIEV